MNQESPIHTATFSPYNTATYMDSEFQTPSAPTVTPQATQIDNLFHAVSNILLQVNHTNQALLGYLSNSTPTKNLPDPKIRPKSVSGLPTEDILTWIYHFENVAAYISGMIKGRLQRLAPWSTI